MSQTAGSTAGMRLLVLDDEPANTDLLDQMLRSWGYEHITCFNDPREFQQMLNSVSPDLILLDLHMPYVDGFQILSELLPLNQGDEYLPVLVLTADVTAPAKQLALGLGAKDFLTKPFDPAEVKLRVHNLLNTRQLHQRLKTYSGTLEERVVERTAELLQKTEELDRTRLEILERLARAAEFRDDATGRHAQRVGILAARVASRLDQPKPYVQDLRLAAPLHDIGKIAVPDHILFKPGPLSEEEWAIMRTHTVTGARILGGSSHALLRLAEEIANFHHERFDGSGYHGVSGEDIPLGGRLVALADVFDALTHARPYKQAWPLVDALAEIRAQSGRQFCPRCVGAFLELAAESNFTADPV